MERHIERLDRYIIEHLDYELDQARERESRLLTLLEQCVRQSVQSPAPAATKAATAPPTPKPTRPRARKPLSGMRKQIVDVLRPHAEGLSATALRQRLRADKDLRPTLKGMERDGMLRRVAAGRYAVVEGW